MAIPAVNASYNTAGPSATGQILAAGASAQQELAYIGTATFVLDGAATTSTLNYIDGTAALPFTPSAVLAARCGGNAAATVTVVQVVDNNDGGKTAAITFGAAGSNTNTVKVAFFILK